MNLISAVQYALPHTEVLRACEDALRGARTREFLVRYGRRARFVEMNADRLTCATGCQPAQTGFLSRSAPACFPVTLFRCTSSPAHERSQHAHRRRRTCHDHRQCCKSHHRIRCTNTRQPTLPYSTRRHDANTCKPRRQRRMVASTLLRVREEPFGCGP